MNNEQTQTRYAIFNKHNGVLFTFEVDKNVADSYSKEHFLVRELVLNPGEYFFGDYYTGKIYSEAVTPLIREDQEVDKFLERLNKEHPFGLQVLTIAMVLARNKHILELPDDFVEFIESIDLKRKKFKKGLEVMSSNKSGYNFVSYKDLEELAVKRVEGIL